MWVPNESSSHAISHTLEAPHVLELHLDAVLDAMVLAPVLPPGECAGWHPTDEVGVPET
jgi:hypothetical protein